MNEFRLNDWARDINLSSTVTRAPALSDKNTDAYTFELTAPCGDRQENTEFIYMVGKNIGGVPSLHDLLFDLAADYDRIDDRSLAEYATETDAVLHSGGDTYVSLRAMERYNSIRANTDRLAGLIGRNQLEFLTRNLA